MSRMSSFVLKKDIYLNYNYVDSYSFQAVFPFLPITKCSHCSSLTHWGVSQLNADINYTLFLRIKKVPKNKKSKLSNPSLV